MSDQERGRRPTTPPRAASPRATSAEELQQEYRELILRDAQAAGLDVQPADVSTVCICHQLPFTVISDVSTSQQADTNCTHSSNLLIFLRSWDCPRWIANTIMRHLPPPKRRKKRFASLSASAGPGRIPSSQRPRKSPTSPSQVQLHLVPSRQQHYRHPPPNFSRCEGVKLPCSAQARRNQALGVLRFRLGLEFTSLTLLDLLRL